MAVAGGPQLRALIEFAASRPGAVMSRRWGETVFRVRHRVFAFLGWNAAPTVTVKVEREARKGALEHPNVRRARYVGIFGWVTVRVVDDDSLRVACELIAHSHRLVAHRR
jgi:predicted DNA-binding protein (MmcQ/YjbR family)